MPEATFIPSGSPCTRCSRGQPAFPGDTPLSVMYQIVHKPFPELAEANRNVSPGTIRVLGRMTARDPRGRYPTATALRADLDVVLDRGHTPIPPVAFVPSPTPAFGNQRATAKPVPTPVPPAIPVAPVGSPLDLRERRKTLFRVKLAGIFALIVGGLSALWALLMVLEVLLALAGELDTGPDAPPMEVMVLTFLGLLVFSAATAALQVTGGVKLLRRSKDARGWGIAAGIAGCASLWNCCIYPLCLAAGIYTLVVLLMKDVKTLFGARPAGATYRSAKS